MVTPPPFNMGVALDRATGADELRRTVEKLKKDNEALRMRIAELERKG